MMGAFSASSSLSLSLSLSSSRDVKHRRGCNVAVVKRNFGERRRDQKQILICNNEEEDWNDDA